MSISAPLDRENRVRNRFAAAAIAAGFLLAGAAVFQLVGTHTTVDELTLDLIAAHKRFPLDLIGAIVEAIAWLGVAGALGFLADSARARNPQMQAFIKWIAVAGPILAAVSGVVYAILIAGKANDFVHTATQTYQQANQLTTSSVLLVVQLLGQVAALIVAVGFVLVSLNSMRVGLLTRFMGYLGIFAGILVLFVITPIPVVQAYWLIAIGYLISGRWPTGMPPAWRTGKAEPWPSNAEMREQRAKSMADRRGGGRGGGGGGGGGAPRRGLFAPRPAPEPVAPEPPAARSGTRATTPKRKRKRRK